MFLRTWRSFRTFLSQIYLANLHSCFCTFLRSHCRQIVKLLRNRTLISSKGPNSLWWVNIKFHRKHAHWFSKPQELHVLPMLSLNQSFFSNIGWLQTKADEHDKQSRYNMLPGYRNRPRTCWCGRIYTSWLPSEAEKFGAMVTSSCHSSWGKKIQTSLIGLSWFA